MQVLCYDSASLKSQRVHTPLSSEEEYSGTGLMGLMVEPGLQASANGSTCSHHATSSPQIIYMPGKNNLHRWLHQACESSFGSCCGHSFAALIYSFLDQNLEAHNLSPCY